MMVSVPYLPVSSFKDGGWIVRVSGSNREICLCGKICQFSPEEDVQEAKVDQVEKGRRESSKAQFDQVEGEFRKPG